jgi:hypothetical protein
MWEWIAVLLGLFAVGLAGMLGFYLGVCVTYRRVMTRLKAIREHVSNN